jgi:hypothetical protein
MGVGSAARSTCPVVSETCQPLLLVYAGSRRCRASRLSQQVRRLRGASAIDKARGWKTDHAQHPNPAHAMAHRPWAVGRGGGGGGGKETT